MYECEHISASVLSRVHVFAITWNVACQAPLFPWNSPGKNIGMSCHFFPQKHIPRSTHIYDLLEIPNISFKIYYTTNTICA